VLQRGSLPKGCCFTRGGGGKAEEVKRMGGEKGGLLSNAPRNSIFSKKKDKHLVDGKLEKKKLEGVLVDPKGGIRCSLFFAQKLKKKA